MRYVFAALAVAFAPLAQAQTGAASYGLQLGSFDYAEQPIQPVFSGVDDSVSSWRLLVGYQFLEHMAVEGAIGRTGVIRDTVFASPDTLNYSTELSIMTVRLLGVMNFAGGFTVLGGIGYSQANEDFDLSDQAGNTASFDQDINRPSYFVGAQYDLDRFAVRLAYEKFDFDAGFFREADLKETSISFFYKL